MDATVDALVVDLLLWLTVRERTYQETLDAWRTSCPRLPVWEDANDQGFVCREHVNGRELVRITSVGKAFLERHRRSQETPAARSL